MFTNKNPYNLKDMDKMPDNCPVCGQKYNLEPMFYTGAMYAGYAISIALTVTTFVVIYTFYEMPILGFLATAGTVLVVSFPLTFRWARTMWINFFVHYDPTATKEIKS